MKAVSLVVVLCLALFGYSLAAAPASCPSVTCAARGTACNVTRVCSGADYCSADGTCVVKVAVGGTCSASTSCVTNSKCNLAGDSTCTADTLGKTCSGDGDCNPYGYKCANSKCAWRVAGDSCTAGQGGVDPTTYCKSGTLVARIAAGSSCDDPFDAAGCQGIAVCYPSTVSGSSVANKTCQIPYSQSAGAPCATLGAGPCGAGLTCQNTNSSNSYYTCAAGTTSTLKSCDSDASTCDSATESCQCNGAGSNVCVALNSNFVTSAIAKSAQDLQACIVKNSCGATSEDSCLRKNCKKQYCAYDSASVAQAKANGRKTPNCGGDPNALCGSAATLAFSVPVLALLLLAIFA